MDKIPTNKKEVAKLIFKTAKEAFRRGYRAWKTSKKQADRLKKRGYGETGIIPYSKEPIKKAIRSVKFQGRAAKLAKKQKKPPGSRARGISFVGRGYQGDKTKTMQVPMITKLERRAIQKSISKSVKKFMKEKIGRKKEGGTMSIEETFKKNVPFSFWTTPEFKWKKWWLGPYKQAQKVDKIIEEIKKGECGPGWEAAGKKWGMDMCKKTREQKKEGGEIKITPKLKHKWTKGPGKSHRHSTYGGTIGFKKGKFSVEGTWKKDKGKFNEHSYESKPSKSIILKMAFGKGGLMRTPKLAKRGF